MSLESDVAGVLRHETVGRISFTIESIAVNKVEMESVAKAIDSLDISVVVASTGNSLGAAYSSFVTRRWDAGEKKLIGRITLGSTGVAGSGVGRAGIFHECVHALKDVQGVKGPMYKISMHNEEVVAYLADAMYLRATKTSVAGDAKAMAIYKAAFAIVDGRG